MGLAASYALVKPSVVAIVSKFAPTTDFPPIIGTGFVGDGRGLIVTNDHVIQAIFQLPRLKSDPTAWTAEVAFFAEHDLGMAVLTADIVSAVSVTGDVGHPYNVPIDVGLIQVNLRDLPVPRFANAEEIHEGDEVGVPGFPLGDNLLRMQPPGLVSLIGPTLRHGVVASVLPFPCDQPAGFVLDVFNQGGSSGSPVFAGETGEIIGLHWGGATQLWPTPLFVGPKQVDAVITAPTGLSFAAPIIAVTEVLAQAIASGNIDFDDDCETLASALANREPVEAFGIRAIDESELI